MKIFKQFSYSQLKYILKEIYKKNAIIPAMGGKTALHYNGYGNTCIYNWPE